ncbi:dolichyl-phosphate-mannose--protein mannosyltransferase [Leptospira gomenensis]|uniref:Dolichyl-phosphate-mannose--protein mannosyltransferase n=1 Tax=Leptospira gomenensis TaxID=2484974 RepID=A0A5F1Z041_9LEPT|nr:glycosyltransferase family 39 protein [Leptospira gomenensis]TGK34477.1 dolichyl-phosphate-mannose--protein mannosyltransferase [Leptospira gomenensis]TGK41863.1 dolichyl-phosphate-mannose--protein mannosyltransferase [Leptospira gomenensis]TGK44800.1 dolichyl-phosphate-mannose--protein mannosyltransferase [Leptospira gomenensis]TGK65187.1 dolichyl-phosphate-mannose--protein mannosyltransferase [Leptospira gomenensis]
MRSTTSASFWIFLLVFFVDLVLPISPVSDTIWNVPTTVSILKTGNFDLDEYPDLVAERSGYAIRNSRGHLYNYFPVGVSILAIPQVFLLMQINGTREILRHLPEAERFIAAGWIALSVSFLYRALRGRYGRKTALMFSLLFAFCTPVLSTAGRALWQQTGVLLVNSILLRIFTGELRSKKDYFLLGALCGFALWIRPTSVLVSVCLFFGVLKTRPKDSLRLLLAAIPFLLVFLMFNWSLYDSVLPPYYREDGERIFTLSTFGEAFLGHWISPSRGLFIWSPFLILSFFGMFSAVRDNGPVFAVLSLSILLHVIVISGFDSWWGGHSVGPRLWTETIPFWIWFAARGYEDYFSSFRTSIPLRRIWIILCILSLTVHLRASVDPGPSLWNRHPKDVDTDPSRVWDWKDPQFLRGDHSIRLFL